MPAVLPLAEISNAQLTNLTGFSQMEKTSDFTSARVSSGMVGWNWLLTPTISGYSRYLNHVSRLDSGGRVPYLPRHTWAPGGKWVSPQCGYVNAWAGFRSNRFTDDTQL